MDMTVTVLMAKAFMKAVCNCDGDRLDWSSPVCIDAFCAVIGISYLIATLKHVDAAAVL